MFSSLSYVVVVVLGCPPGYIDVAELLAAHPLESRKLEMYKDEVDEGHVVW